MEECTSADTGVGAAIAAGSHLENGICALLVIAATMIVKICGQRCGDSHICIMFQCPWARVNAIAIRIITSPIRLVSAVIIPAAKDLGF